MERSLNFIVAHATNLLMLCVFALLYGISMSMIFPVMEANAMKGVSYERRIVSNSTNTFSLSGLILVVILATLSFKRIINRQKNIATIEIKKATFIASFN